MAVLGFILGLGFLIPIAGDETRAPASSESSESQFGFTESRDETAVPLNDGSTAMTEEETRESESPGATITFSNGKIDARGSVLFDVHTISNHRSAKNTDAWVQVWINKEDGSFSSFLYCHNYDYKKGHADATLDRYAAYGTPKSFKCSRVSLEQLMIGRTLLDTALGPVLTLKAKTFDPKKGGTLSVIFAHRISMLGGVNSGNNTYRAIDFIFRLRNSAIFGPKGEYFDWINLRMHENKLGMPVGVSSFELRHRDKIRNLYKGETFPKVAAPKTP
jgi:hypothetical protein